MNQTWKRHGVGALVTCTFVVLVWLGTASGQQIVYVNCPSQTVTAGVQAVHPGGEVVITWACPEALTINKPLTLRAQGPATVLIGLGAGGGTSAPPLPSDSLIYHLVAEWSDPFTPPQSRTSCIGWFITDPPWCLFGGCSEGDRIKTCSEWKTEWRHMMNRLYIRIDLDDPGEVDAQGVRQCFQQALIAGTVGAIKAAVLTGGKALPAAAAAFQESLKWCLLLDFIGIRVSYPTWSGWSDWG
jgi:hypothetical protein